MNKDKTEIIIVLDRSGSMGTIKADMEGGLKTFIEEQKKQPGICSVSLYQFDTTYDVVFENTPIAEVKDIVLNPRGGTALHDAVGKTINKVGQRLKETTEDSRPGLVIFLVITDGEENASREFGGAKIKEMVTHQTEKYQWKFTFLGANQDAVLTGKTMGYAVHSSMSYSPTSGGVMRAMNAVSCSISSARNSTAVFGLAADVKFSEEDRKAAMDDSSAKISGTNSLPVVAGNLIK